MRHRKQDDDTGVSEMKAFGEELIATGARYIEAGKRWFDTRRDEASAQRHERAHGAERGYTTREHTPDRHGPDEDGHGRSAWLGGRPARPDLYDHENARGDSRGHAYRDEPPRGSDADPAAGPWRHEHRWQPRDTSSGRGRGDYGSSDRLRDSDDHLSDWGHRARPGQQSSGAYPDQDRPLGSGRGANAPGGWRGVGPKGYVRSDARITEEVCEQLMHDDAIDARGISVQVSNGVVTLEGQVSKRSIKHRVEDLVEGCAGVRDIDNRLRVQRGDAQDERGVQSGEASSASRETGSATPSTAGGAPGLNAQGAPATSGSATIDAGGDDEAPDDDGNPHRP